MVNVNGKNIKLIKKLGEGNFATIYQTSVQDCVAKITYKNNPKGYKSFLNEQMVFTKLN